MALSLLAAPLGGADPHVAGQVQPSPVTVSARASVRILPGARILFDEALGSRENRFVDAVVTVEDGSRRDARLVEFQ